MAVERAARRVRGLASGLMPCTPEPCICATREYPHFDPHCPQHGKLSRAGDYDERQVNAVKRACEGCGVEFYFTGRTALCWACRP